MLWSETEASSYGGRTHFRRRAAAAAVTGPSPAGQLTAPNAYAAMQVGWLVRSGSTQHSSAPSVRPSSSPCHRRVRAAPPTPHGTATPTPTPTASSSPPNLSRCLTRHDTSSISLSLRPRPLVPVTASHQTSRWRRRNAEYATRARARHLRRRKRCCNNERPFVRRSFQGRLQTDGDGGVVFTVTSARLRCNRARQRSRRQRCGETQAQVTRRYTLLHPRTNRTVRETLPSISAEK